MTKKLIKVMDTSFRDGFQSVYGARVFVDDFLPALKSAVACRYLSILKLQAVQDFNLQFSTATKMHLKLWTKSEMLLVLISTYNH